MKIAIIGLSNSGKTTVFNALTGQSLETTPYASVEGEPRLGVVGVPDERLDKLSGIFKPKKTTHATVDYLDYIGITKSDPRQNAKIFEFVKGADALLQVVRAFEDPSVPHPPGSVDPLRDLKDLELELILMDLDLAEKRLQRMEESRKKGKKPDEAERKAMLKCKESLEKETPLRAVEFTEMELKSIRHLDFVSIKPELAVFNISEDKLKDAAYTAGLIGGAGKFLKGRTEAVALSGKIEMELSRLPAPEAGAFLEELGIEEPALNKLIKISYRLLDYICFFTVGEDEVKAWTIKRGDPAPVAAGKVHSDIEKGFIRAEVISYTDFMQSGGTGHPGGDMAEARKHGLLRLEGKTYEVRDGDIINFRFNV